MPNSKGERNSRSMNLLRYYWTSIRNNLRPTTKKSETTMGKSRAEYFKNYNPKSPVKSIRIPLDLITRINEVVIQQNSSFSSVVIQSIENNLSGLKTDESCSVVVLQQMYDLFLRNVKTLKIKDGDIDMIKTVEGLLDVAK